MEIKKLNFFILQIIFVGSLLTLTSYYFFELKYINYYNIVLELTIALGAVFLLYSIQAYKKFIFYKALNLGFFILFVSFFVDAIDQIFIHGIFYTVFMEKISLIIAAIFIYIGSKQWMTNYKNISLTDELTQIPNRKHTRELINQEITSCINDSSVFCLMIIDIDFFKRKNDEFGHYFGDLALFHFAQFLINKKPQDSILGRWGGEEFVLALKNTTKQQALVIAEKMRKKITNNTFLIEGQEIQLTASFGVSEFSYPEYDFKKLFVKADKALYKAKNSGRNKVM